jgi:hypothetical protein
MSAEVTAIDALLPLRHSDEYRLTRPSVEGDGIDLLLG